MNNIGRGIASIGVCALGAYAMWLTGGATGIGWAVFGLLVVWAS